MIAMGRTGLVHRNMSGEIRKTAGAAVFPKFDQNF
jgi:hypothetical protein